MRFLLALKKHVRSLDGYAFYVILVISYCLLLGDFCGGKS